MTKFRNLKKPTFGAKMRAILAATPKPAKPVPKKLSNAQRAAILKTWEQGAGSSVPALSRPKPVLATVRKPVERRTLTPYQRATVAARQRWRCATCCVLFKALWHIDHITPLADGGEDDFPNMQALCANCHTDKTAAENAARS